MIIKHFHRYKWELNNDWENIDHIVGAPNEDASIEQSERQIAIEMSISDDEMDELNIEHLARRRIGVETPRKRRGRSVLNEDFDDLSRHQTQTTQAPQRYQTPQASQRQQTP